MSDIGVSFGMALGGSDITLPMFGGLEKHKKVCVIVHILLIVFQDNFSTISANSDWTRPDYSPFEFYTSNRALPRADAENTCKNFGSTLINLDHGNTPFDVLRNFPHASFIGLEKRFGSRNWTWSSSNLQLQANQSRFLDSKYLQRSRSAEECAYALAPSGEWMIEPCDSPVSRNFVCQRRKTRASSCADVPCYNQGTCMQRHGRSGFICICRPGLTGERCTDDVQECSTSPSPCLNNGVCIEQFGSFACICSLNFTGRTCDTLAETTTDGFTTQTGHSSKECCPSELCRKHNASQIITSRYNCSCDDRDSCNAFDNIDRLDDAFDNFDSSSSANVSNLPFGWSLCGSILICLNGSTCRTNTSKKYFCDCPPHLPAYSCQMEQNPTVPSRVPPSTITPSPSFIKEATLMYPKWQIIIVLLILGTAFILLFLVILCLFVKRHMYRKADKLDQSFHTVANGRSASNVAASGQISWESQPLPPVPTDSLMTVSMAYAVMPPRPCSGYQPLLSHQYHEIDEGRATVMNQGSSSSRN